MFLLHLLPQLPKVPHVVEKILNSHENENLFILFEAHWLVLGCYFHKVIEGDVCIWFECRLFIIVLGKIS